MAVLPKIFAEALALPKPQRAELVTQLLISLDGEPEEPTEVQTAWNAEIRSRCEAMDRDELEFEDWDTVRSRLASRTR